MSAGISISRGIAEAAFAGAPAWHNTGTVVREAMTVSQALEMAHLGWLVAGRPMFWQSPDGAFHLYEGRKINVRVDTEEPLGDVSDDYRIVQSGEAFETIGRVLLAHDLRFEAAGALNGGRRIWLLARTPEALKVNGDVIEPYIMLLNSHDGTTEVIVRTTGVRVVCQNTVAMALAENATKSISLRHVSSFDAQLKAAEGAFARAGRVIADYGKIIEELQADQFSDDEGRRMVSQLVHAYLTPMGDAKRFPVTLAELIAATEEKKQHWSTEMITESVWDRAVEDRRLMGESLVNSWLITNAIGGYVDHDRPMAAGEKRMNNLMFGRGNQVKELTTQVMLEHARTV